MKIVLQRVTKAHVSVQQTKIGEIDRGLLLLIGIEEPDTPADANYLAKKILQLRIFSDENKKMNLSVMDIGGGILCISQFTLLADCTKGNRPSFIKAAPAGKALKIYNYFVDLLKQSGLKIETGQFAADMKVHLTNDGPVTLLLNSK